MKTTNNVTYIHHQILCVFSGSRKRKGAKESDITNSKQGQQQLLRSLFKRNIH